MSTGREDRREGEQDVEKREKHQEGGRTGCREEGKNVEREERREGGLSGKNSRRSHRERQNI